VNTITAIFKADYFRLETTTKRFDSPRASRASAISSLSSPVIPFCLFLSVFFFEFAMMKFCDLAIFRLVSGVMALLIIGSVSLRALQLYIQHAEAPLEEDPVLSPSLLDSSFPFFYPTIAPLTSPYLYSQCWSNSMGSFFLGFPLFFLSLNWNGLRMVV